MRCGPLRGVPEKYGIDLPDRQLVCAPIDSPEGEHYLGADARRRQLRLVQSAAADVAGSRGFRSSVFGQSWEALGMNLVYDVCPQHRQVRRAHGRRRDARACGCIARGRRGPFRPGTPKCRDSIRAIGQPVIIPGDMGRASWVLVGQAGSMQQTFGTACHGAGR